MPVNFRIAKLEIRGFRGLAKLDVAFSEGTPTYVVGANNAGKSTVLSAMACAFRQASFMKSDLGEFDFHHSSKGEVADEFTCTALFEADDALKLPAVQGVGNPVPVHGVRTRGRRDADGSTDCSTFLIDDHGKTITFSTRLPIKKAELKNAYKQHEGVGFQPRSARPQDIQNYLPEVWHLRPDNIHPSLYTWKSGPLMRLAKMLSERFFNEEWTFKFKATDSKMPQRMVLAHEFFKAAVAEFPFWKETLKPRLDAALSSYLGRDAGVALRPSVQRIEEWLAQQLALAFAADSGGPVTPLESMGDGWQSMVRLAALDVLRQMPDQTRERIVLLFEEPEAFLHPHLRRKLREVLADLSKQGWVVVCTTHAPEFINFQANQQVLRMCRTGDEVTSGVWLTSGTPTEVKAQEKLDEHGNHEMLFANRVVLCEGKDDEHALHRYLRKTGIDLDGLSVSIVPVGSVNNLPSYASIASTLGIPWCAVLDEDKKPGAERNAATVRVEDRLNKAKAASDKVAIWAGDLEACLGKIDGKATPEWQEATFEGQDLADLKKACPQYATTSESVCEWVRPASA